MIPEYIIREDTLHYAARFLERWEEKSPNINHSKVQKDLRDLSNFLLDNQGQVRVTVVRFKKDQ